MRKKKCSWLSRFLGSSGGAAAPEYAAIAGLTAMLVIPAITAVGIKLSATFSSIATATSSDITGSIGPSSTGAPTYASPNAEDPGSSSQGLPPAPPAPDLPEPVWGGN